MLLNEFVEIEYGNVVGYNFHYNAYYLQACHSIHLSPLKCLLKSENALRYVLRGAGHNNKHIERKQMEPFSTLFHYILYLNCRFFFGGDEIII